MGKKKFFKATVTQKGAKTRRVTLIKTTLTEEEIKELVQKNRRKGQRTRINRITKKQVNRALPIKAKRVKIGKGKKFKTINLPRVIIKRRKR